MIVTKEMIEAGAAALWAQTDDAVRHAFDPGREPFPFADVSDPPLQERYRRMSEACLVAALPSLPQAEVKALAWATVPAAQSGIRFVTDIEAQADQWRADGHTLVPLVEAPSPQPRERVAQDTAAKEDVISALRACLRELEDIFPNPAPNGAIAKARAALTATEGSADA